MFTVRSIYIDKTKVAWVDLTFTTK